MGGGGVVMGAVFVSFWGQHPPIAQAPAPRTSGGDPVVATHVDTAAMDSRMRQVVREELARHDAIKAPRPLPDAPPHSVAAVASAEVVAQTARANAVLD